MPAPLLAGVMGAMLPGVGNMFGDIGENMGLGKGLGGGLGKGGDEKSTMGADTNGPMDTMGNMLGFGSKDKKFDKVSIKNIEIDTAKIGKLIIEDLKDLKLPEEEEKEKLGEETLTSDLPEEKEKLGVGVDEETLTSDLPDNLEKDFSGGLEDTLSTPIQDMEGSNAEMSDVLQGKGAFGGGFSEVSANTNDMTSSLEDISSILGQEDPYSFQYEDEGGGVSGLLKTFMDGMIKGAEVLWGSITDVAKGAWTVITETVTALWTGVTETVGAIWTGIKETAGAVWDGIKEGASGIWDGIKEGASGIWEGVKEGFDIVRDTASGIWHEVKDTAFSIWDSVGESASGAWNTFTGGIADIASSIFGEEGDTVIQIPMAKDLGGDVMALRDTLYNIYDCLLEIKDIISNVDTTFMPESTLPPTEDLAIVSPTTIVDEKLINIPQQEQEDTEKKEILSNQENEHQELSKTVEENANLKTLEESRNMNSAADQIRPPQQRGGGGTNPVSGVNTKDTSKSRGMDPSYTKESPPPVRSSKAMTDEIRSYDMYPKWRTKLG